MNPNNLTQEQIKQGYSTIPGAYDPLTGKLKTSNVITPDSLAPQPKLTLPTAPVPTTAPVPQTNLTETMLKTLETDQTEAQKVQETGIAEILKSMSGLTGEAQALATEKEKTGFNVLRQDLQGINSQILRKQAELQQDDIQLISNMRSEERRDTLLPFAQMGQAKLAGDAQIVRALKNAEIGVLNATALAKQGDIALAQQTAEEAVAIKYEPYKDNIRKWENTLKVIEPLLTRDEKKQAEVQKIKGQLAMREIEKAEVEEKSIQNLAFTAISTGNAPSNILSQVQGKSVADALTTLAPYLKTQNTDVIQLDNGSTLLIDKNSGKIIKNYGGAKPVATTSTASPLVASSFGTLINTTANLEDTVAGKTSVKEQLASMLNQGDYTGAYNQIANSVAKGLTGETKNRFENARIDYEVLSGFKTALQSYIDAGGDTGLLKGTAEQITRKLGAVTDPNLTSLAVQLQREFQTYRNTMTGAAFTPKESAEYASVNPTATKSLNLNLAVVDGALNQLQNRVDGTIRAKVPQASDIQKIRQAPQTAAKAKQQVNTIYTKVGADVKSAIENMVNQGIADEDILDYLQLKGLQ